MIPPSLRTQFFAAALSLTSIGLATAANVTVYTDRPSWEAAVGGVYIEEDFDDNLVNAPGLSETSTVGTAVNMQWEDQVADPGQTTTWSFSTPVFAWGATIDTRPVAPGAILPIGGGSGIDLYVDLLMGTDPFFPGFVPAEFPGGGSIGFYGIVSDMPFSSVVMSTTTTPPVIILGSTSTETYTLDDLVFSAIPEPSRALLLVFGIAAVTLRRRRLA